MNVFEAGGVTYTVGVTVGSINRVRAGLDVRLDKACVDNFAVLNDLLGDPCKLVDVVYLIVKPQADAHGVTAEQFGESLAGDTFEKMSEAFISGLIDFFPERQRNLLKTLRKKSTEAVDLLASRAEKMIEAVDPSTLCESLSSAQES